MSSMPLPPGKYFLFNVLASPRLPVKVCTVKFHPLEDPYSFWRTWLWRCAEWREVPESRTSGVGPGQRSRFLVLTKRSAASCERLVWRWWSWWLRFCYMGGCTKLFPSFDSFFQSMQVELQFGAKRPGPSKYGPGPWTSNGPPMDSWPPIMNRVHGPPIFTSAKNSSNQRLWVRSTPVI